MDVQLAGTSLYAEERGAGPTLVFVHGMCGDARVWSGQVERLSDRFRCVTYDRRGHTRSPRTDAAESVQLHADDLAQLIEAVGLPPCVVVGSSGGARLVVDLLRRHARLVRGAVLSEPPIAAIAPDAYRSMIAAVAPDVQRAEQERGPRAAVDAFFRHICPGLWSRIDDSTKDRYRDNAAMLFADLSMPPYEIDRRDVAAIDVPVLVIGGRDSHPALRSVAKTIAEWLPRARYLELPCGHVTYAEEPDRFADATAEFAAELVPD